MLAWGDNNSGQLGTGTHARCSFQPVPVKLKLRPGVKVRAISAGLFYGMALTTNRPASPRRLDCSWPLSSDSYVIILNRTAS